MTLSINIGIKTQYLADQSAPDDDRFVFSYTITLTNRSGETAQLISRHWVITDGNNAVQEVKGMGVVGQQPVLEPGASYTYSSGVVLPTETGTMTGTYQMRTPTGTLFDAPIPVFALVPPHLLH
jgi:ApaG protein